MEPEVPQVESCPHTVDRASAAFVRSASRKRSYSCLFSFGGFEYLNIDVITVTILWIILCGSTVRQSCHRTYSYVALALYLKMLT